QRRPLWYPQNDAAHAIGKCGSGHSVSLLLELLGILGIGGEKNVKWRSIQDLRVKVSRRAEREMNHVPRVVLEVLDDFLDSKIEIGCSRDVDALSPQRNGGRQEAENPAGSAHNRPKNTQQTKAPMTLMDNPQIMSLLNKAFRSSEAAAFAMQSAPSVESGETSTRCAPTLTDHAIAMALPPPIFWISPGIVGMNAGITTPEELLYTEMTPVTNPITPVTEVCVEKRARIVVNRSMPPFFSRMEINTVTPDTIKITFHGMTFTAFSSLAARASVMIAAAMMAAIPT